jgi:hypothetical protein
MRTATSVPTTIPTRPATLRRRTLCALNVTLGLMFCAPAGALAQSACPAVDAAWFTYVASGTPVAYGYTLDAALQTSRNGPATPVTAVGVITFQGLSIQPSGNGSRITGVVTGSEKQNAGGTITSLVFGIAPDGQASTFTFDTSDCSGTISRVFANGTVVDWQVVVVDGGDTIRYIDTRSNPSVRSGSLQLIK